ncbi:Peptidase family S41 [Algoriphagus locisalis]|uniref:Peptidase family S41 n=1 Tax=Algoriphagus locisalis TaxID=305507 RepID=A0A1I7EAF5_9BACT|nr:S41 family peptidase [Algoriphagus locisalis]SFU20911.1 Peptidase family S41 [Algoriphagus locisalis]
MKQHLVFIWIAILVFFSTTLESYSQTQREIDNLVAFSKAYGYVKYFHPSTESDQLDWGWFSVYGANQVRDCQDISCLNMTLNELFKPVAPTVLFSLESPEKSQIGERFTPSEPEQYNQVYWQHYGVGKDMINPSKLYKSVRVNSTQKIDKSDGFGGISKSIDAKPYLNKKVRLTGRAKMTASTGGNGHFWLRVDNTDKSPGYFENMDGNPITSAEWKAYEIIGDINPKASTINFGGFLSGKGTLLVDNLELEVEEDGKWKTIPLTNSSFEDPIQPKDWYSSGKGYEFTGNVNDQMEENKSLQIHYKGEFEIITNEAIFPQSPEEDEVWVREISEGLWIGMPLTLYEKDMQTYPIPAVAAYNPDNYPELPITADGLDFRLGNIINTWNVFQHFYPYFKETGVDWESELKNSLRATYSSDGNSHYNDLKKLTAKLKDGHIQVYGNGQGVFAPPIAWEWIENKLIITQVFDPSLELKVGDQVDEIAGISPELYFNPIKEGISAATQGYLNYRANDEALTGAKESILNITVRGKEFELVRWMDYYKNRTQQKASLPHYQLLDNEIVYLNLDLISIDTIKNILPELKNSKAIIADLRGYPKGNHEFIKLLLDDVDSSKWMMVNKFIYPDQENIAGHSEMGWEMVPEEPHLGNKKVIFIIDEQAISYAESYMGFIEANNLAVIIGQPTAGTNGNINMFALPGEMGISFTGMKVVKHDGSQLHGVGILPDIYLEKTIEGIKAGRDEFLEKAIELAQMPD